MGYAAAGIRDVAAVAGVSYTLVGRYFGSKAGLLEAALVDTMDLSPVLAIDRARFGENLAQLILSNVGDDAPISMTILAAGDSEARQIAEQAVKAHVIAPLAAWLGQPDGEERAVAITMLAAGFVTFTHHMPLLPLADGAQHPLAGWLAQGFQAIVDRQ